MTVSVVDSGTTEPADSAKLARLVCCEWLGLDDVLFEGDVVDRDRNGNTRFRTMGEAASFEGWRCELGHPDSRDPGVKWRLHYWRRDDGTFEFASVDVYDDMKIPE